MIEVVPSEILAEELGIFYPSENSDIFVRLNENVGNETKVIERLLQQKKVTVFHKITTEDDFESMQNLGIMGNYKVRTPGGTWFIAYFSLLHPATVDGTRTAITLNKGERKLRIYDNREGKSVSLPQLIEDGWDGSVEVGGVGVPLDQKFMLRLFDGTQLKGQFNKVSDLDEELG